MARGGGRIKPGAGLHARPEAELQGEAGLQTAAGGRIGPVAGLHTRPEAAVSSNQFQRKILSATRKHTAPHPTKIASSPAWDANEAPSSMTALSASFSAVNGSA